MVDKLHQLIDSNAAQPVINERIAGLIENNKRDVERIGTDHEKRIRFLERTVSYTLGVVGAISAIIMVITTVKDWVK